MKVAVLVIMMEDGPESGQRQQYPEQKISAGVLVVTLSLPVLIYTKEGSRLMSSVQYVGMTTRPQHTSFWIVTSPWSTGANLLSDFALGTDMSRTLELGAMAP